jgi:hypothetical protein
MVGGGGGGSVLGGWGTLYSVHATVHRAQSRQSAKLFLLSSELGLPQPLTRRRVCPLPPRSGGSGTLAGERGVGRVPIPTRGQTLWYSLHIRTLCHRVFRMPGFLSSRPNWVPPNPPPARECCSSPLWVQGGTDSLEGEGVGEPNSDERTDTLVLFVYYIRSTPQSTVIVSLHQIYQSLKWEVQIRHYLYFCLTLCGAKKLMQNQ